MLIPSSCYGPVLTKVSPRDGQFLSTRAHLPPAPNPGCYQQLSYCLVWCLWRNKEKNQKGICRLICFYEWDFAVHIMPFKNDTKLSYFLKEIEEMKEMVFYFVTIQHLKIVKAGSTSVHLLFYIKTSKIILQMISWYF